MIDKIGIIGLGLIGGSLAKALKRSHPSLTIMAYDRDVDSLIQAKEQGVLDTYETSINANFSHCNLLFLCLPVEANLAIIKQLAPYLRDDCILTDVSSTKSHLNEFIKERQLGCTFIGGHPMTGSEKTGYAASKAYLFENAYYILCPYDETPEEYIRLLTELISSLGALTLVLDADEHDYITSVISHFPHLLASSLVYHMSCQAEEQPLLKELAAGGFKDITRIASSNPDMWASIFKTNETEICKQLEAFIETLEKAKMLLEPGREEDLHDYLIHTKDFRDRLNSKTRDPIAVNHTLRMDVADEPGVIAKVTTLLSEANINIKNIGIFNYREHISGILEIVLESEEDLERAYSLLALNSYEVFY